MAQPRRKKKSDKSIIPVLFTLGVIGWGFFAIDRLTEPLWQHKVPVVKDKKFRSVSKKKAETKSVKEQVLGFINEFTGKKDQPVTAKKTAPAVAQTEEQQIEIEVKQDPNLSKNYRVYFYQVKNGDKIELKSLKRPFKGGDQNQLIGSALRSLLRGPSAEEQLSDFTHSFRNKPTLLSYKKQGSTLVLNFNSKFGKGISFHLLRLQITQLLKTSVQFDGINSISIRIGGRKVKHLGSAGLSVPERISLSNWSTII